MAEETNLPTIAGDTLKSTTAANRAAAKQSKALTKQIAFMNIGAGMLNNASISLDKYAKGEQRMNPLRKIKDIFHTSDMRQQALQKKQQQQIAERLGISREELLHLQKKKELTEAEQKVADEFRENAAKYGINLEGVKTSFNEMGQLIITDSNNKALSLEETLGKTNAASLREMKRNADAAEEQAGDDRANSFLAKIADGLTGGRLSEIENNRERSRAEQKTAEIFNSMVDGLVGIETALKDGFGDLLDKAAEKGGKGIGIGLGLLAAPIALSVGLLQGLAESLSKLAKIVKTMVVKPFQLLGQLILKIGRFIDPVNMEKAGRAIGRFTTKTADIFKKLTAPLKNASAAFKAGFAGLSVFRTTTGQFGRLGFFGKVGSVLATAIDKLKGIGAKIKGFFQPVGRLGTFFQSIGKAFTPIVKTVSFLGRTIGKAFLPLTIILTAFDGIKGAIEGFNTGGIIGGIVGAFKGIVDGLIYKPLDLLKDFVSWIAGKLGFEQFSEFLDSFDISFDSVFGKIGEIIDSIKEGISGFVSRAKDGFLNFFGFGGDDDVDVEPPTLDNVNTGPKITSSADLQAFLDNMSEGDQEFDENNPEIAAAREQMFKNLDAMDGAEINARSQTAASSQNIVTVVAPQTSNVVQTSQNMNQTVAVPVSPTPSVSTRNSGRSRRRNR